MYAFKAGTTDNNVIPYKILEYPIPYGEWIFFWCVFQARDMTRKFIPLFHWSSFEFTVFLILLS